MYLVKKATANLKGIIKLDGSKSISNRVLLIQALCKEKFTIHNLSTSDDTQALQKALANKSEQNCIDVGAAGTTMRFLTAYFSLQKGTWTLTGSERMKQRPIGVLVKALQTLGATIEYVENTGYPPLQITGQPKLTGDKVAMTATVSSQYISALLLIAPTLANGLTINLEGQLVSRPYLEMTLRIMEYFGIQHTWIDQTIQVLPQTYQAKDFTVEADWSAASYYYAMAAMSDEVDLALEGLQSNSLQGDSVLAQLMDSLGVATTYTDKGVKLTKKKSTLTHLTYNFISCPDIAQSVAVVCAGLGIPAHFSGLITLSIKETDRTKALQQELAKVGVDFQGDKDVWTISFPTPKVELSTYPIPTIKTYHDHRMAMAFAPLAIKLPQGLQILDPMVVTKSYPIFWEDIAKIGFLITK